MTWPRPFQNFGLRALSLLTLAVLVMIAGCGGLDDGSANGTDGTDPDQATETPPEPTDEPTDESTDEPTDEPTAAPPDTDPPAGGDGGDGGDGAADPQPTDRTLLWVGVLLVFLVGFVVATVLRRRNSTAPTPSSPAGPAPVEDPQTDAEKVISLLHRNNGRVFEDVMEEELDWSPTHTRRVLSGLIATGDVERREMEKGVLITFTDPEDTLDEDESR